MAVIRHKTHCNRGHLVAGENLLQIGRYGRCRICYKESERQRHLSSRKRQNPYIPRSVPIEERHSITLKQNQDRMWAKIDQSGGDDACWPWTSALYATGYAAMSLGNRPRRVTRLLMELQTGSPIPKDVFVCHKCDNPICCNPSHLFLGSPLDNAKDRDRKGRGAIGDKRWNNKLTLQDVRFIRESADSVAILSERYGVAKSTIYGIRQGIKRTHIA